MTFKTLSSLLGALALTAAAPAHAEEEKPEEVRYMRHDAYTVKNDAIVFPEKDITAIAIPATFKLYSQIDGVEHDPTAEIHEQHKIVRIERNNIRFVVTDTDEKDKRGDGTAPTAVRLKDEPFTPTYFDGTSTITMHLHQGDKDYTLSTTEWEKGKRTTTISNTIDINLDTQTPPSPPPTPPTPSPSSPTPPATQTNNRPVQPQVPPVPAPQPAQSPSLIQKLKTTWPISFLLSQKYGAYGAISLAHLSGSHDYMQSSGLGQERHNNGRSLLRLDLAGRLSAFTLTGNVTGESFDSTITDQVTGEKRGTQTVMKYDLGGSFTWHISEAERSRLRESTLTVHGNSFWHQNNTLTLDQLVFNANVSATRFGLAWNAPSLFRAGDDNTNGRVGLALAGELESLRAAQTFEGQSTDLGSGWNSTYSAHLLGQHAGISWGAGFRLQEQSNFAYPGATRDEHASPSIGVTPDAYARNLTTFNLPGVGALHLGAGLQVLPLGSNGQWGISTVLDHQYGQLVAGYSTRQITNPLGVPNAAATNLVENDNRLYLNLRLNWNIGENKPYPPETTSTFRGTTNFEP